MDNIQLFTHQMSQLVNLKDALDFYGFEVNERGYTVCPFHNEKTGSLRVWSDHYYCFGCGERGDIVEFVKNAFNLTLPDAMRKVNSDFGLNLPLDGVPTRREAYELNRKLREMKERKKKQAENRERVMKEYFDLLQCCDYTKRIILEHEPELKNGEDVPDIFWWAVRNRDRVNFEFDNFDLERALND